MVHCCDNTWGHISQSSNITGQLPLLHNNYNQLSDSARADDYDLLNCSSGVMICRLPRLSLGIAHDYGCVRSMKWCPSGCAAELTPTIDNSEVNLFLFIHT